MTDTPSRSIRLLYNAAPLTREAELTLDRDAAHYLRGVMRLSPGETLRLFNGADGEWLAEALSVEKRAVVLAIRAPLRAAASPPDLELLFAPIKKARTDFIVEKATELGCRRIRPVLTERTNAERVNVARLQAHAVEAAEQCELVFVPEVAPPEPLRAVLDGWDAGRALVFCDEERTARPLSAAAPPPPAAILIGPEGGFTPGEAQRLRAAPFVTSVSLGPRILRADTAAAAAIALWQAAAGDAGADASQSETEAD